MKTIIIAIIISFTILGCNKNKENKNILNKEEMRTLIYDMNLGYALETKASKFNIELTNLDRDLFYSVLKKHNITDSIYKENIVYYTSRPEELLDIYNSILKELTEKQDSIEIKAHRSDENGLEEDLDALE